MPHPPLPVALVAGALLAGALAMTAGCATTPGSGQAGPPAVTPTAGQSGASASPGPLGTTPSAPDCTAGQLSLSQLAGTGGGPGAVVVAIQLLNGSSSTCSLYGYPSFTVTVHSVSMSTDLPAPVLLTHGGTAGIAFLSPPTKITVEPGRTAGFLVAYDDQPTGGAVGCDHASQMMLTLPGIATATAGPVDIPLCSQELAVSPFLLGTLLSLT